jgi:hypothetical protein
MKVCGVQAIVAESMWPCVFGNPVHNVISFGKRRVDMYAIQKTVMTLLLLVATAAFATGSMADGHNASKAAPMKFVGTYFGLYGATITFNADGTMSAVEAGMFSDDPATSFQGRKLVPSKGVWRAVGDNTIRVTAIRFTTEPFGHNYEPGGLIMKSTWEAVFDKPVQGRCPGYTVSLVVSEFFLPGQNPLADVPLLTVETPAELVAVRMEVE